MISLRVLYLVVATATPALAQADADAIPDPLVTPGQVVSTDRTLACAQGHTTRPRLADAARQVLMTYGVPWSERGNFEIDHLIPRCLGGADAVSNLWPQPLEEAVRKDKKEHKICHLVCDLQTMSVTAGQRYFIETKWR